MGAVIEQNYRGRDVQKIFGIGQSTMYEYINQGILPKPIKLGRTSIWIKSEIDEVNETIKMDIPDSREYDTFSGYVLDQIGRIPQEQEEIPLGNFLITVKEMDGNRISEYIVRLTEVESPKEASPT